MNVLFVTSELAPWVKTGGLGDVAAALPPALTKAGNDVRILVPYYPALRQALPRATAVVSLDSFGALFANSALHEARVGNLSLLMLDCPAYYDRPGNPYLGPQGRDWPDNYLRFGLLSRVAAWLGSDENTLPWQPDVIHCNDWQSALAAAYLRLLPGGRARSLVTIHNLAFQGLFPRDAVQQIGLPESSWSMDGVEFYGHLSFLKAGLRFADAITTVSPTYAREIQTEADGMGLGGLLHHRAANLHGILNGIDDNEWDPAHDLHLPYPYDVDNLDAKAANKHALQAQLHLPQRDDLPLLGIVSRLTHQKGLDLVTTLSDVLPALPVQLAVLGSGDGALEELFRHIAERHRNHIAVKIGFDESLAHRIEAGADMFLMPSRFEPCGLNQMYSLRYGTPPIVRATGGLADTVIDGVNGFTFLEPTPAALLATLQRAVATWRDRSRWRHLQQDGMARDHGWAVPAQRYSQLYASL